MHTPTHTHTHRHTHTRARTHTHTHIRKHPKNPLPPPLLPLCPSTCMCIQVDCVSTNISYFLMFRRHPNFFVLILCRESWVSDEDKKRSMAAPLIGASATRHPRDTHTHTPSIAFRHLPPDSARFSYATEWALFISAQLSRDAVSALRKVRGTDKTVEAT